MQKFNFLNQSNPGNYRDNNQSRLVNYYLKYIDSSTKVAYQDISMGKFTCIAVPTPGPKQFSVNTGTQNRLGFQHKGVLYSVIDNKFYSVASDGTKTLRGTLNTSSGWVRYAATSDQIILIDGTNGYHYNTSTTTATFPIVDADFPQTATGIASTDEYFIAVPGNSAVWQYSNLADGLNWSAIDFFSAYNADVSNLLKTAKRSTKGDLWLFGTVSVEIWYNTGDATTTFAVNKGGNIGYGLAAIDSLCHKDNTFIWLASSPDGGYDVVGTDGYSVIPISTDSISEKINSFTTVSDARAFIYTQNNHTFYVLTFPTEGYTAVYDTTTKFWHERQSYISGNWTRFAAQWGTFCYGKVLVGDCQSGNIYQLDNLTYTDIGGVSTYRFIQTSPTFADGKRVIFGELTGFFKHDTTTPSFTLSVSKDGGRTFPLSYTKTVPTTSVGFSKPIRWQRLGSARDSFVFKLESTSSLDSTVLGFVGRAEFGNN